MTRTIALIAAASIALSGCGLRVETLDHGVNRLDVYYDEGGLTIPRQEHIAKLIEKGTKVYVHDGAICRSACTMYLGLPPEQLFIHPGSNWQFHGAVRIAPTPLSRHEATWELAKYYPTPVRKWFYQTGTDRLAIVWRTLKGRQLHEWGVGAWAE